MRWDMNKFGANRFGVIIFKYLKPFNQYLNLQYLEILIDILMPSFFSTFMRYYS